MQKKSGFLLVSSLLLMLLAAGCAHYAGDDSGKVLVATSEAFQMFSGEYENTPFFSTYKPTTIAVLPFQDLERKVYSVDFDAEQPANIVRRGMYNHVASLPFKDVELYDCDLRLKNAGLTEVPAMEAMISENPKKLKSILGADAVVTGTVTHFDRIFLGIYSQVAVGCEAKLWDLNTGNLLWRAKHVSRAHAGGITLNPIGLVVSTVASVWNLRQTEMFSQTDALFREIVSTIELPESALVARAPAPRIDLFAAMNAEKPYTLGKKVAFRLIGDPGCKAYVDLGDFKSGIPLTPVSEDVKRALRSEVMAAISKNYEETGHELTPELMAAVEKELAGREIYEGAYTVGADEERYDLTAVSYLVDAGGNMTTIVDPAHTIHVDSLPPAMVAGLGAASLDGKFKLTWTANTNADLTGYEIWMSDSPLSGYDQALSSEKNSAIVSGVDNFSDKFVKVRAVDRAGNSGDFSSYVKAVALPVPGLYDLPQPGPALSGDVTEPVLLVAEKSPYTVFTDWFITQGGMVYVTPGVELLFAPDTSVTVTGGGFMAYGQNGRRVRFAPKAAGQEPGAWQGIILKDTTQSLLKGVVIEQATVGITIENSSPTITAATVTESAQAGIHLLDNARPNITCSTFTRNSGLGALVIEGEGVVPVIRNNAFTDNTPFQVQSYTPLRIDLSQNFWGSETPDMDLFLGEMEIDPPLGTSPGQDCGTK